jgi:signal peptidase I
MKLNIKELLLKLGKETLELIQFVATVLALFFFIRIFIGQPFIVDGTSMSPNFETGQFLIIDKLTYHITNPTRGDVIVFKYTKNRPKDASKIKTLFTPNTYFIKRIIGLPGDRVVVANSVTTITTQSGEVFQFPEPFVVFSDSIKTADLTLGEDEYFVMGDNRAESYDSRSWGALKEEDIEGRAFIRVFPAKSAQLFPAGLKDYTIEE